MSWGEGFETGAADRLVDVFGEVAAGLARACDLIVEADRGQEFLADGAPNMAQWLTARFGVEASFGRRLVKVAHRLQDLPTLRDRFASGGLSFDAVEVLSEFATSDTEACLADDAEGLDLAALQRMARRADPPSTGDAVSVHETRWLSTQWDLHRAHLDIAGRLAGAEAQIVEDRLHAAAGNTPPNPETGTLDSWDARMADGLVEVCATSGDLSTPPPQLTVHVDLEALVDDASSGVAEISRGPVIANQTARRLACDAVVEVVIHRDNIIVGVGRNSRTVPGWLRRLVEARDHHCRWVGCDRTRWVQAHHIQHWADGGATDLDNLILLCGFHHRFLHEHGWHITGNPHDQVVFRRPDWTPYPPPAQKRDAALVGTRPT
ncbi:MAG: DUF222 domain-containing protein [Actinobacteria bacterium]|nr:DUF222 domain-containing protein [Actinomycetota bacterium]